MSVKKFVQDKVRAEPSLFERIVNGTSTALAPAGQPSGLTDQFQRGSGGLSNIHNLPGVLSGSAPEWGTPARPADVQIGALMKNESHATPSLLERLTHDAVAMLPQVGQPTALWDQFQQNIDNGIAGANRIARVAARNVLNLATPLLPVDAQGNRVVPEYLRSMIVPALSQFDRLAGPDKHHAGEGQGQDFPEDEKKRILEDVQNHRPIRDIQDLTESANSLDGKSMSVKLNTKYPEEAKRAIDEWNKLGGIHITISGGGALDDWDLEIKDTDTDNLPKGTPSNTLGFYGTNDNDTFWASLHRNIYLNQSYLDKFNGTADGRTKEDEITSVITHELGHSMGMDHSLGGNVMYYSLDPFESDPTKIQTTGLGPVDKAVFNQIHHAAGGDIKGPGSSIGDKIPAFLSDGEFVVNAASANANRPLLKAINDDPAYMKKYNHQMEQVVAAALTKVRAAPNRSAGANVDQSMSVHISAYDVHEAFAKAKLWEQRHTMINA
ncbi:hypothetical protein ACFXO9_09640 [Nocardia tengchongensis]|uniref:hypothetical protein n=1 Tax=Nocardia tengchongensis TaxID=2055889 RepID=UPI0036CB81A6